MLNSVGLTISQVVGIPASYVSAWFAESRRLRAATRQLTGGILEVEYSIYVPVDSFADSPDIDVAEATLNSVNFSSFTSLLQDNIDSNFGEAVYSVSVLAIEAVVVEDLHAIPAEPDDTQASASSVLIIIAIGIGCCIGSLLMILTLFSRRRRALRLERDWAQKGRTQATIAGSGDQVPQEDNNSLEFIFDMDEAEDRQELPPNSMTRPCRPGGDQAPWKEHDRLEFVFDMDNLEESLVENRQELAPTVRMPIPSLQTASGGGEHPLPEDDGISELIFDMDNPEESFIAHPIPRLGGPSGGGDQPPPEVGDGLEFVFDMDNPDENPLCVSPGPDFALENV